MSIKSTIKSVPVLARVAQALAGPFKRNRFNHSADYWETRYQVGGNSGAGSYSRLARFKAEFLNDFVASNDIRTIIEFGSGDGAQLDLAQYPDYVGVDVAPTAVEATRRRFAGDAAKRFYHSSEFPDGQQADLTMSLDVVYHLVEDESFDRYMRTLFDGSSRFVIIYSSNEDSGRPAPHVRHRRFTDWIAKHQPDFALKERVANAYPFDERDPENTSFADFYIFERQ